MMREEEINPQRMLSLWPFRPEEADVVESFGSISDPLIAGWWDEALLGFIGLASFDGKVGYVWGYPVSAQHSVVLALHCRRFMRRMRERYQVVYGNCSPSNLRWNQLCFGAEVIDRLGSQLSFIIGAAHVSR